MNLSSAGLGALAIGRALLVKNPLQQLQMTVGARYNDVFFTLWNALFQHEKELKPAILFDPKDAALTAHIAVQSPGMFALYSTGLTALAEEGLVDGVEFRRLARKQLRPGRRGHVRTVLCADPIFATSTAKRVLQHIAGRQMRIITLADVVDILPIETTEKQSIRVLTPYNTDWTHARAVTILQQKLAKSVVKSVE